MEYYSAIKRNKLLAYKTTWMNLKHITLSKKKKADRKEYTRVTPFIYETLEKRNLVYRDKKQIVMAWEPEAGRGEWQAEKGHPGIPQAGGKILYLGNDSSYMSVHICQNSL